MKKIHYLETNDSRRQLEICQISVSQEDREIGNPFNTEFYVKAVSGSFAGEARMECDYKDLCRFANELYAMYHFTKWEAEIQEPNDGSYLRLYGDRTGHVRIEGQLFDHARENAVIFEFEADQTECKRMAEKLYQNFGKG